MLEPVEYEFELPDGSKRYEIVYERREVLIFQRMHGARSAKPIDRNHAEA